MMHFCLHALLVHIHKSSFRNLALHTCYIPQSSSQKEKHSDNSSALFAGPCSPPDAHAACMAFTDVSAMVLEAGAREWLIALLLSAPKSTNSVSLCASWWWGCDHLLSPFVLLRGTVL